MEHVTIADGENDYERPLASKLLQKLANAEVVIDEWIETARKLGRPIPEPRGKLAYA
jgi:hypothetical protein